MKSIGVIGIVLGAIISLTPNTTGDSIAGAVMLITGTVMVFWPLLVRR